MDIIDTGRSYGAKQNNKNIFLQTGRSYGASYRGTLLRFMFFCKTKIYQKCMRDYL